MHIRSVMTAVAFLAVLAGFAGFARWYWGPAGPPWPQWGGMPTGRAAALSVPTEEATATPVPTQTAEAAPDPNCPPGRSPSFVLGFADLKKRVGAPMGDPVECEHAGGDGETVQQTTTGLAYYRPDTNTAAFTDGWRHWAVTPRGLVHWEGEAADPPPDAAVAETASPG